MKQIIKKEGLPDLNTDIYGASGTQNNNKNNMKKILDVSFII